MEEYAVILTHSTSHTIRVEKILKEEGFATKMIPVPRHVSSDCGSCVKIKVEDKDRVLEILKQRNAQFDRIELL
jgi:hypothetical protein